MAFHPNTDRNLYVVILASRYSAHCISLYDKHLLGINGAINKRGTTSDRDVTLMDIMTTGA